MKFLIFAIAVVVLNVCVTLIVVLRNAQGNLRIDYSDECPLMFLELESTKHGIDDIKRRKFVVLRVVNENYIKTNPQK